MSGALNHLKALADARERELAAERENPPRPPQKCAECGRLTADVIELRGRLLCWECT